MSVARVLGSALAVWLWAASCQAAIVCEQVSGSTRVQITIDSPADGDTIPARTSCGGKVTVSGSFLVEGPPPQYDFYIVIDASGSTTNDSGADVNRNGIFGEPADNIYQAEIQAAEDFIRAVDPAASRVAIIRFSDAAFVRQPLTTDLAAAIALLNVLRGEVPRGGTFYVPALEAVRVEMTTNGDLTSRSQHGVFLSDGEPTDGLPGIEAKATELAALRMMMDTFALGAIDSTALRRIAEITRGTFTPLSTPGDIVALLPSFAPVVDYTFESVEETAGNPGIMVIDDAARTFQAIVNLHEGANVVTLVLSSLGTPPAVVECTINLTVPDPLTPDAGPSGSACGGRTVPLDASRSTSICFTPIYRWLDCTGAPLSTWSTSPFFDVDPCSLPCDTVTLEMTCEGESCTDRATTIATCEAIAGPAPALASACALTASLTCGSTDPSLDVDWDLDPLTDSDGDGDARNDADATGCDVVHDYPAAGAQEAIAWLSDPATGCTSAMPVRFTLSEHPAPADLSGGTCPTVAAAFSCGTAEPGVTYWWDFDVTTDSDGNGIPDDDPDETGCDVSHVWSTSGLHPITGWAEDAAGCRRQIARGTMDVSATAPPGETTGLRLSRSGDAVTLTWTAFPGAVGYRVLRGSLVPLQDTGVYDHAADDAASQGTCQVAGTTFTDPDDVRDPEAFYYLVTALNDCAGEGPTGFAWDRHQYIARPERIRTASCP